MAYKLAIAGIPNSGKSFSRRTIPDGENVFLIAASNKITHLKTSKGEPIKHFDLATPQFPNKKAYKEKIQKVGDTALVHYINENVSKGKLKPEMLKGNIALVDQLVSIPIWLKFISEHLPWVHTAIIPDFTHFISKHVSTDDFINRKAGGEAYQKFWEMAATVLKNFINSIDNYRHDLIVVTEYHAEYDENLQGYDIFSPAGKMLKEKFLVPSYYDVLLFTDVKMPEEDGGKPEYRFVTRQTKGYPYARAMDIFEDTFIPNDLNMVLTKLREYTGIETPHAVA